MSAVLNLSVVMTASEFGVLCSSVILCVFFACQVVLFQRTILPLKSHFSFTSESSMCFRAIV